MSSEKLEPVATLNISANDEFYKVVDFLNKNLKDKNLIFGLSQEYDEMSIKIYKYE